MLRNKIKNDQKKNNGQEVKFSNAYTQQIQFHIINNGGNSTTPALMRQSERDSKPCKRHRSNGTERESDAMSMQAKELSFWTSIWHSLNIHKINCGMLLRMKNSV